MNTIFSDFSKDVDLSIFRERNKDPKTPLRRHYLSNPFPTITLALLDVPQGFNLNK